jgi:hypothetical protein
MVRIYYTGDSWVSFKNAEVRQTRNGALVVNAAHGFGKSQPVAVFAAGGWLFWVDMRVQGASSLG